MKNDYEKYMNEVWKLKEQVYNEFKKSGKSSYVEFLKEELKNVKINYKNRPENKIPV